MNKKIILVFVIILFLGCFITYRAGLNSGINKERLNDELNGTYRYRKTMLYMTINEDDKKIYILDQNHQVFKKTLFKNSYKKLDVSTFYFKDKTLGKCYVYYTKKGVKVIISSPDPMVMSFTKTDNIPTYWGNYFKSDH